MAIKIVEFPSYNMVILHSYVNVYQRVYQIGFNIRVQHASAILETS